jgi:hypothetical protein
MAAHGLAASAEWRSRQLEGERRPLIRPRVFRDDRAAVELGDVPHDGEPESEATMHATSAGFGLPEGIEDEREELGRDPAPAVGHGDLDVRAHALEHDLHRPALRRELDGVGQQVPDELLQTVRITGDQPRLGVQDGRESNALCVGRRTDDVHRPLDHVRQRHRANLEPEPARDDSRDVEKVVDQLRLRSRVPLYRLERASALFAVQLPLTKHAGPRENRREWRSQLVRHHGQERVLRARGGLGQFASGLLAREQVLPFPLLALSGRDVARDLGGADDSPRPIADGRHGQRDVDLPPVLRHANRLEVVDALAASERREHARLFRMPFGR